MNALLTYLPEDRAQALARGMALPDRSDGAALFADISGFTALTEALTRALGPQRGAEELTGLINQVYDALVAEVERFGGSVISFSGDAVTCWFDADDGRRAAACALAMQQAMRPFSALPLAGEDVAALAVKVAVVSGPVRRFLVGDPNLQLIDVLAGETLDRLAAAEHHAARGEVVLDRPTAFRLRKLLRVAAWREGGHAVVAGLTEPVAPLPWPALAADALPEAELRCWVLPVISQRLRYGQDAFLAELRPAVALFLGFDGFDYDHDPSAGEHLDAYIRWVQTVIARYDGALLQLTIGDKGSYLYASFGAPTAHDDDILRAVATALELGSPPAGLAVTPGPVRIGMSQGMMRTGGYGAATRRTYGVLGDEVNLAARLMQQARPGQVVVSKRVADLAGGRYRFEPLGAVALKGKAEPMPVFALLGRQQAQRGAGYTSTGRAPLTAGIVGREEERAALDDALAAFQRGVSGVVLVEGEAGIGKSRLLADVLARAGAQGETLLLGAGDAIEQRTSYHAWRPVFEQVFGWDSLPHEPEARRASVLAWLAALPDAAFVVERAPLLSAVLPLDWSDTSLTAQLAGEGRAVITNEVLVRVLRHLGPLVLIVEDAHWLDSASWALLRTAAEQLHPALLIVATRPLGEPVPAEYRALRERPITRQLHLSGLPPAETLQLVCSRLGVAALPEPVADLIRQKAEGHPFFSEELAFALRDAGLIEIQDGQCRLAAGVDLSAVRFPDTAQGVVISRIDRLTPTQQLTLKAASVIGRVFAFRMLHAIHPLEDDRPHLPAALQVLERLDLTPLETPEPEPTYLFKHIITQEAAYSLLLFAQRQGLHRAVAEWIERDHADDLSPSYPLLAYHWGKAEDVVRTLHYLELAGEQALSRGAYREAALFFREALRLAEGLPQAERPAEREGRWESRLGMAVWGLGDPEGGARHLKRALALFGRPMPETTGGILVGLAGQVLWQAFHLAMPRLMLRPQRNEQAQGASDLELIDLYYILGGISYHQKLEPLSVTYYILSILNLGERLGVVQAQLVAYGGGSIIADLIGLPALAQRYDRRAKQLLERFDNLAVLRVGGVGGVVSIITYRIGVCSWDGLPELLGRVVRACEQLGDLRLRNDSWALAAWAHYFAGDLVQSRALFRAVYAAAQEGSKLQVIWGLAGQLENGLWLGAPGDELLAQIREAERLIRDGAAYPQVIRVLGLLARVSLRCGDLDRARAAADEAARWIANVQPTVFYVFEGYAGTAEAYLELWRIAVVADPSRARELQVAARVSCRALMAFARPFLIARPRAWLWRGVYAWQRGQQARARQAWRRSLEEARRYQMPLEEALAHHRLGLHGEPHAQPEHRARAAAIFARLGVTYPPPEDGSKGTGFSTNLA